MTALLTSSNRFKSLISSVGNCACYFFISQFCRDEFSPICTIDKWWFSGEKIMFCIELRAECGRICRMLTDHRCRRWASSRWWCPPRRGTCSSPSPCSTSGGWGRATRSTLRWTWSPSLSRLPLRPPNIRLTNRWHYFRFSQTTIVVCKADLEVLMLLVSCACSNVDN